MLLREQNPRQRDVALEQCHLAVCVSFTKIMYAMYGTYVKSQFDQNDVTNKDEENNRQKPGLPAMGKGRRVARWCSRLWLSQEAVHTGCPFHPNLWTPRQTVLCGHRELSNSRGLSLPITIEQPLYSKFQISV